MSDEKFPFSFTLKGHITGHARTEEEKERLENKLTTFCQAYHISTIGNNGVNAYLKAPNYIEIKGRIADIFTQDELSAKMNYGGYINEKAEFRQGGSDSISLGFRKTIYFFIIKD